MEEFEKTLAQCLSHCSNGVVKEAALYSLMIGGKRMRPKLLFGVLKAYGIAPETGYKAAAAIEMMHTYSLIHDDLPSMDNDTLRRGKPTCHIQYGEDHAILAGDALLTHSFEMMANAVSDYEVNLALVKELAKNGGLDGMIYGQELDLKNENNKAITLENLKQIHRYKTGNLIALPMVAAAIIAGKNEDIEIWRTIGYKIGLLFQIQDDVFDVVKTSEELGKNANSDLENEKQTYVSLLGLEGCKKAIQQLYQEAEDALATLTIDKKPMEEVFQFLLNRNH